MPRSNRLIADTRTWLILVTLVVLTCGLSAGSPLAAQSPDLGPRVRVLGAEKVPTASTQAVALGKGLDRMSITHGGGPSCVLMTMTCNSTVNGSLTVDDCALEDGTFADFWSFSGANGQTVTVNATSNAFDSFLFLLNPVPELVATDDDSGGGSNARIVHTLDQSGDWGIAVNNFFPQAGDPGSYTLSLDCSQGGPTIPLAPTNLTASPFSTTEIDLSWQDRSNNEDEFRIEQRMSGGGFQDIGSVPASSTEANVFDLQPATAYDFRVRARNAAGNSGYSNIASATTRAPGQPCAPSQDVLCFQDNRFEVEVDWATETGAGLGKVVPGFSDDSAVLYFFSPDNWEMLVKVLDGCSFNDHYWVFFAATTDVEFNVTVTDTERGIVRRYFNPIGNPADAITDTEAFTTCP